MTLETITVDRPTRNHPFLILPTLKIVTLTSITVDGQAIDLDDVRISADAPGVLSLTNWQPWGGYQWNSGFGGVDVTLSHGFTAAEAEDWREAVLALVDRASLSVGTGAVGPMTSKQIDDVAYGWSGAVATWPLDRGVLSRYRLL